MQPCMSCHMPLFPKSHGLNRMRLTRTGGGRPEEVDWRGSRLLLVRICPLTRLWRFYAWKEVYFVLGTTGWDLVRAKESQTATADPVPSRTEVSRKVLPAPAADRCGPKESRRTHGDKHQKEKLCVALSGDHQGRSQSLLCLGGHEVGLDWAPVASRCVM